MPEVRIATTPEDITKCFEVIRMLRPHLDQVTFVATIEEMISEGYILAFVESGGKAVAAIGYRYLQMLYIGKHFYIDDLVTLPDERGKGLAGTLLDHVFIEAKKRSYKTVTLDSGYQRHAAHKLYLDKGFTLNCHHFLKDLN